MMNIHYLSKHKIDSYILNLFVIVLIVSLLSGCGNPQPSPVPTSLPVQTQVLRITRTPTITPTITPSPTLTLTSTPTTTPTPTLYALQGTPFPDSFTEITATNADQISAIATWRSLDISDMAWTPDSEFLTIATSDRIEFVDVDRRQLVRTLYPQTPGIISIDFGQNLYGSWLVAGSRRGTESEGFQSALELWRGPNWDPRGILSGSTRGLSDINFSPNGKVLAAVYSSHEESDNVIEFLDTTQWTISTTLQSGLTLEVAFSPDAVFLATSPDRYAVNVWDINRHQLAYKFRTAFTDSINTMTYSPDGKLLATGDYAGQIKIWDMQTGSLLKVIQTGMVVESIAFSPNGQVIASGGGFENNNIMLWDVASGDFLRLLEGHSQGIDQLLFSPDGQMLVSGSFGGEVIFWAIRP